MAPDQTDEDDREDQRADEVAEIEPPPNASPQAIARTATMPVMPRKDEEFIEGC